MADKKLVEAITSMEEDFAQWYTDVVKKAELMDYTSIKGCMVFKPAGYAIWELIQRQMDDRFKETGVENVYLPMFISESLLNKEKDHVEGFAPEVAWVTYGGMQPLQERLCVRPTSETLFCDYYKNVVQSYRDLPQVCNQWCSVVRWEKETRPFLRSREFLWQEGHTAFATPEEAHADAFEMMDVYKDIAENVLSLPVLCGRKSEKEKFAGAVATYGMEAMMKDGKSLQSGTSHYLGQNFAKAFDIKFLDKDGVQKYAYTSSWGVSTRLIGALIMAHGDKRGLVLPPKVAPEQVVIVPIAAKKGGVVEACEEIKAKLESAGVRVIFDNTDNSPGWKFNEWEMKGVPVRIEVGPRDLEAGKVILFRRDTLEKSECPLDNVTETVKNLLDTIQREMLESARVRRDNKIVKASDIKGILAGVEGGNFVKAGWCGCRGCEDKIKETTAATARVMLDELEDELCAVCGKPAKHSVYFARAY